MRATTGANRNHPKFNEYREKCEKLRDDFRDQEDAILARYPEWHGLDNPADDEINPLRKKFHADLKALQKEYSFLFTET